MCYELLYIINYKEKCRTRLKISNLALAMMSTEYSDTESESKHEHGHNHVQDSIRADNDMKGGGHHRRTATRLITPQYV